MRIRSVLVANRGEIAVRVLRTAISLGYRTIAVYSDADSDAPHVRLAHEAVRIGPGPAAQSYLDPLRILDAARSSRADAVHPGYGFLSENAAFATACADAGIVFVGPSPAAIAAMGSKAEAKRSMIAAGVPCVPGYEGEDQSDDAMAAAAAAIGFPIMVKASAGGGGRGMRLAHDEIELRRALSLARAEAESAFGSGELILERAIRRPRHVEIQIFADQHGNVVHLGERDCSLQRRHQKVVEEAPCPVMTAELRARMGAAAVEAARAISYCGAGTVEFLLDDQGEFYSLEMNTRLQVEHPVTELVTGLDLVALQLRVAEGEPLGFSQDDVTWTGHAIEARLYAEDPEEDFRPTAGTILRWEPASVEGVRIDDGIRAGQTISPFYDPMLAKIVAWGPDRETARRRLLAGLDQTTIFGVTTNAGFLRACLSDEVFITGDVTTAFLDERQPKARPIGLRDVAVGACLAMQARRDAAAAAAIAVSPTLLNWSSSRCLTTPCRYRIGSDVYDLDVRPDGLGAWTVGHDAETLQVVIEHIDGRQALVRCGDARLSVAYYRDDEHRMHARFDGRVVVLDDLLSKPHQATAEGSGRVVAPMHGIVVELHAVPGQVVSSGDCIVVVEAMKMFHQVRAEVDGTVAEIAAREGQQVAAGDLLVQLTVDG